MTRINTTTPCAQFYGLVLRAKTGHNKRKRNLGPRTNLKLQSKQWYILFKNTKRTHYVNFDVITVIGDLFYTSLMTITRLICHRNNTIIINARFTIHYYSVHTTIHAILARKRNFINFETIVTPFKSDSWHVSTVSGPTAQLADVRLIEKRTYQAKRGSMEISQ